MAKPSKSATAARAVLQGGSFGASDEVMDLIGSLWAKGRLKLDGQSSSLGELLGEARGMSVQELKDDYKENPITAFVSNVAGSIPVGATAPIKAAYNWAGRGGTVGQLLKSASLGAGFGGATGFASGGDSVDDRLSSAAIGTVGGGVFGPIGMAVSKIGGNPTVTEKAAGKVARNYDSKARKFLAEQLAKRPDLQEAIKKAEVLDEVSKAQGIPLTTAEKLAYGDTDPLIAQQSVIGGNPITGGRMAQMYKDRGAGIEKAYENVAGKLSTAGSYDEAAGNVIKSANDAQNNITRELVAKASPLYEQAYQKVIDPNNAILKNPIVQFAMDRAKGNPAYKSALEMPIEGGTVKLKNNSIQVLDAVKRQLDDMAETAGRSGSRNEARLIEQARSQLLSVMDEAAPEYSQARQIYSGQPDKLAIRERLGSLAEIDPNNPKSVANTLTSGTQRTANLAAEGLGQGKGDAAAAIIRNAIETNRGTPESLVRRIAPNDRTSEQLNAFLPTEAGVTIGSDLGNVNELARRVIMGNRVIKGSPTQPLQQAQRAIENAAGGAVDIAKGNVGGAISRVFNKFKDNKEDPQFYEEMYGLLTTDEGMDLVRQIGGQQGKELQKLNNPSVPMQIGDTVKSGAQLPGTTAIPQALGASSATLIEVNPDSPDPQKAEIIRELKKQKLLDELRAQKGQ